MITVTCAIIEHKRKVLVVQRSETMRHPLKWEFPGGKLEEGEGVEACILREIREELAIEIKVIEKQPEVVYNYPDLDICLIPFRCIPIEGKLNLKEHQSFLWLSSEELKELDWAAADIEVLRQYLDLKKRPQGRT